MSIFDYVVNDFFSSWRLHDNLLVMALPSASHIATDGLRWHVRVAVLSLVVTGGAGLWVATCMAPGFAFPLAYGSDTYNDVALVATIMQGYALLERQGNERRGS